MRLRSLALVALLPLAACNNNGGDLTKEMAAYQASIDAAAAKNLKAGQDYLATVAAQPGIVKLPSGVMYKVVTPGTGAQPKVSDTVTTNYEGKLVDGTVFDSSFARNQPASFPLNRVVPAWQEVIPLMHAGEEVMMYVPASQGYGERDMGDIPPNSTLIFRVQLLSIGGK